MYDINSRKESVMQFKKLASTALGLVLTNTALASDVTSNILQLPDSETIRLERVNVIKRYIKDLQKRDYQDITQLFTKDGVVISTSRGKVDAKEFFYGFLPSLSSANTELYQYFDSGLNSNIPANKTNHFAARFHFAYEEKTGEKGEGEYMDEFVFAGKYSSKLAAVYMFENVKFPDEDRDI